jgi:hypothetical protein
MKSTKTLSDLQLERYLLGELSRDQLEKIRKQLEEDENAAGRLALLRESNEEILAAYPPETIAIRIRERREKEHFEIKKRNRARSLRIVSFTLPAAAALFLVVTLSPVREWITGHTPDTIRLKGLENRLNVYRKTEEVPEQLEEGVLVHENDVLQLSYFAGEMDYGIIFSIDGRGVVTFHFPESSLMHTEKSPPLEKEGEIPLSLSYILDNAPYFERFFFVSSNRPFRIDTVLKAAEQLALSDSRSTQKMMLALGSRFHQATFLVLKGR